jgi:Zn-dependent metalloprotease
VKEAEKVEMSLDVIGHELTHGVVQYEAGLIYQGESRALNKSFADAFGSPVKQRSLNQNTEEADRLIGLYRMIRSAGITICR